MVSLYSTWWLKPEFICDIQEALDKLVSMVRENEKDNLMYLIHTPILDFPPFPKGDRQWVSEPAQRPGTLVFVEKYRSWDGFIEHAKGEAFNTFFSENKHKFVEGHDGGPFVQTVFMEEMSGYFREK